MCILLNMGIHTFFILYMLQTDTFGSFLAWGHYCSQTIFSTVLQAQKTIIYTSIKNYLFAVQYSDFLQHTVLVLL